jgi:DNA-binding NarL/FixJ family response regulator
MSEDTVPLNVLLVDDQPAVRHGLRMQIMLNPGFVVIGEAGTAADALLMAHALQPDVVVMDVEMPGLDGIVATERLLALQAHCIVIVLSIHDGPATRARALAAGAQAFVSKRNPQSFVDALNKLQGSGAGGPGAGQALQAS